LTRRDLNSPARFASASCTFTSSAQARLHSPLSFAHPAASTPGGLVTSQTGFARQSDSMTAFTHRTRACAREDCRDHAATFAQSAFASVACSAVDPGCTFITGSPVSLQCATPRSFQSSTAALSSIA